MTAPHPLTLAGVVGGLAGFWVGEPLIAALGFAVAANEILIEGTAVKHRIDVDCRPTPPPPARKARPLPDFDEREIWRTPPAPGVVTRVSGGVILLLIGAASGSVVTAAGFILARLAQ